MVEEYLLYMILPRPDFQSGLYNYSHLCCTVACALARSVTLVYLVYLYSSYFYFIHYPIHLYSCFPRHL